MLNRVHLKNFYRLRRPVIFVIFTMVANQSNAAALTLDQFLQQVKSNNQTFESSRIISDASIEKSLDAESPYNPTLFSSVQFAQDQREYVPESQRGNKTSNFQAQAGISKMTKFGTAAKATYTAANTKIDGTDPRIVPESKWNDGSLALEVTHPLLKNSGGSDLSKSIELQTKQSQLTKYSETLKRKMTLAESEGVYWRLVLARESIRTARENSDRAKRLVDWNKKRVQTELADDADLVQAQSLWDLRNLELTVALDEERSVSHMFNTLRGVDKTQVSEELDKITPKLIEAAPIPQKLQEREDLTLAKMSQELTQLGLDLASHKYDPSLDVFASYSLTGRDEASISKMAMETVGNQHPVWAVGFKFSTPIGAQSKELIGAWSKEKQATDLVFARKSYELNREWQDLVQRLDESRNRLKLIQKVEETQNKKLELERDRQRRGRSTMFQVIQFETDLAQAQLNVIRNKSEILSIISRMKTFGGEG